MRIWGLGCCWYTLQAHWPSQGSKYKIKPKFDQNLTSKHKGVQICAQLLTFICHRNRPWTSFKFIDLSYQQFCEYNICNVKSFNFTLLGTNFGSNRQGDVSLSTNRQGDMSLSKTLLLSQENSMQCLYYLPILPIMLIDV